MAAAPKKEKIQEKQKRKYKMLSLELSRDELCGWRASHLSVKVNKL